MSGENVLSSIASSAVPGFETNAFEERVIYVYEHVDVIGHKGWLKVGQTKKSRISGNGANARIEEQHEAANIAYRVLYVTPAVTNDGKAFSDHAIHAELVLRGIPREATQNPNTNRMSEWFKTDIDTVIKVIEEFKANAVKNDAGVIMDFNLRKEQQDAVDVTADYYQSATAAGSTKQPAFLWNAKPRFGKTLTSYVFAREVKAEKVLVLTNRPAVADSWFNDFKKFDFLEDGQGDGKHRWLFSAAEAIKNRLGKPSGLLTRDEFIKQLNESKTPVDRFVHFISLQDIRGRNPQHDIEEFKKANSWIFHSDEQGKNGIEWDLLIIDESHEGAETSKSLNVLANVNHQFALHLSGTPFKALASNKFDTSQIFNWSYADEQLAKETWSIADGENPYGSLPKLNIFTYQLSNALRVTTEQAKADGSDFAFDLGEFFRVAKVDGKDQFVYRDKVAAFVGHLAEESGSYPYADRTKLDTVRHSFWLLPGVKQCLLLKDVLNEHPYFKEFDIIVAAGTGDDDKITKSALEEVRLRINGPNGSRHPLETKTITLSCGQLTTGVTVPEWTSVFMLNNIKSPAVYMQTAFRAQNPFEVATSGGEKFVKENCFVYDFAPDRILRTIAELAESGSSDSNASREEKVRILINFLPVIAEDEDGSLRELNANDVLTMPLRLVAQEVVTRGFMSNKLFTNIGGIFGAPESVLAIINKLDPEKDKKIDRGGTTSVAGKTRIWEDRDKNIHINDDIVINTQNGLFGDKKYVEVGSDEADEVKATLAEATQKLKENGITGRVADSIVGRIEKMLPTIGEPKAGDQKEKEQPDQAPKKADKSEEEKVRDRLRGFTRTIPSFLMAYGDASTTIDNFEVNIPDETFVELTSITKEEFVQLRDGFDFEEIDSKSGETVSGHFDGLFNKAVFNSSIQEFNNKRAELSAYYLSEGHGDIFEYIPPQSTNQIFTPTAVVKMVVDRLENANPELFTRTDSTFIDPYMKSGLFITEVAKRLFTNTRAQYKSDLECIQHILEKQLFGLAPTDVLQAITQSFIFGFDSSRQISRKNFVKYDLATDAESGTAVAVLQKFFGLGDSVFKFDAVVGNPPYQIATGKKTSRWIFFHFQNAADKIARTTSMIYPFGGWFDKPNKFGKFGERMLSDRHTISVDAFEGSTDPRVWMRDDKKPNPIFASAANLSAGIAIVLRDLTAKRESFTFSNRVYSDVVLTVKFEEWANLTNDTGFPFAHKLTGTKLASRASGNIFAVEGDFVGSNTKWFKKDSAGLESPVRAFANHILSSAGRTKEYWVERKGFVKGQEHLDKFKIVTVSAFPKQKFTSKGSSFSDVNARLNELVRLIEPPSAYGGSRIALFMSDSRSECENFMKYLNTHFFAYLVTVEPNARSSIGAVIPDQDFSSNSDINWGLDIEEIDKYLFRKYDLSETDIKLVLGR